MEDLKEFYRLKKERQLGSATGGEAAGTSSGRGSSSAATEGRPALLGVSSSDSDEEGLPGTSKVGALGKRAVAAVGELESMPPPPPRPIAAAKSIKPLFKVIPKSTVAAPAPRANSVGGESEAPATSGGLAGLLGGYGSSGSDGSP